MRHLQISIAASPRSGAKVDAPVNPDQIQHYRGLLAGTQNPAGRLLLPVSSAKRIPPSTLPVAILYWEDVHQCAQAPLRLNSPGPVTQTDPRSGQKPLSDRLRSRFSFKGEILFGVRLPHPGLPEYRLLL